MENPEAVEDTVGAKSDKVEAMLKEETTDDVFPGLLDVSVTEGKVFDKISFSETLSKYYKRACMTPEPAKIPRPLPRFFTPPHSIPSNLPPLPVSPMEAPVDETLGSFSSSLTSELTSTMVSSMTRSNEPTESERNLKQALRILKNMGNGWPGLAAGGQHHHHHVTQQTLHHHHLHCSPVQSLCAGMPQLAITCHSPPVCQPTAQSCGAQQAMVCGGSQPVSYSTCPPPASLSGAETLKEKKTGRDSPVLPKDKISARPKPWERKQISLPSSSDDDFGEDNSLMGISGVRRLLGKKVKKTKGPNCKNKKRRDNNKKRDNDNEDNKN